MTIYTQEQSVAKRVEASMPPHDKEHTFRWSSESPTRYWNESSVRSTITALVTENDKLRAALAADAAPVATSREKDWRTPTTYLQRFGDALQLLCGKRPSDEIMLSWYDENRDSSKLQEFCVQNGPHWTQGIGIIDAAEMNVAGFMVSEDEHDPANDPASVYRAMLAASESVQRSKYGSPEVQAMILKNLAVRDAQSVLAACAVGTVTNGEAIPTHDDIQQIIKVLSELASYDTYETEYDGQMMTLCHYCDYDGEHTSDCIYKTAKVLVDKFLVPKKPDLVNLSSNEKKRLRKLKKLANANSKNNL